MYLFSRKQSKIKIIAKSHWHYYHKALTDVTDIRKIKKCYVKNRYIKVPIPYVVVFENEVFKM